MKMSLSTVILISSMLAFVGCSSGQKSSSAEQAPPPPQASLPVVVTPSASMSGSATMGPMSLDQLQSKMDQCMSMHKDTNICSRRVAEDCQVSANPGDCSVLMKNVKVLRAQ